MIEHRCHPDLMQTGIAQNLDISSVSVPIQDKIIQSDHLIDRTFPSVSDAEIIAVFSRICVHPVIIIERRLALSLFF